MKLEKMSTNSENLISNFPEIDVLIVGGGISGLTASYKILSKEPSLRVLIVEADSSVGGQIGKVGGGVLGSWAMNDHYHILKLCKELNIATRRKHVLRPDMKRFWEIDRCNFIARFELKRFIAEIDIKSQKYRPGTFKIEKNSKTMEKYICSKLFFEQSRSFVRFFVRLLTGVHPKFVAMAQFMGICYSAGGLTPYIKIFTGTDLGLIEIDIAALLWNIQQRFNSMLILTEKKIIEIIHYTDYVIARDENGNVFHTSVLILAIPWLDIMKLKIYPPIPPELQTAVSPEQRFLLTSFKAKYIEGYWRRNGYSGSMLAHNLQFIGFELKPTTYGGFILHDDGLQDIVKDIVLDNLSQDYGEEMLYPKSWKQITLERDINLNLPLTTPWNRIIWASNSAATTFRGHMSGAVQSGLRAAFHALLTLRPQNVQWQDIDEIQRASAVYPRFTYFQLFRASVNVYNSIFYVVVGTVLITIFRKRHSIIGLVWK